VKRFILPGIPFVVSMALSLSTAGSHCYWQDSGFFLVAVKELGILYPPGFALYVLLCKAWTLALWFVDFTYAVHLFSAFCAALAAGTIAVAARDLLRTGGPVFHTVEEEGPLAEWVGASIGCLAASGYTFWAAAILAKVYAFYFLVLSLLIWRMIRADEDRRPRDFTIVAVLIGLAWQAHPSAANTGLALILFVSFHRSVVGWKGLLWRTGLAALSAIGPILLLPLMHRNGVMLFGNPDTFPRFIEYVVGSRFISGPGRFGLEVSRAAAVGRFFWEEFLGIGAGFAAFGIFRLWKINRRLLLGLTSWIVPVLLVTVLFKIEGQHDFWMVAAWIPLWLSAAVGLSAVGRLREAAVVAAVTGTIWAVLANRPDLDQRSYTTAETLGHLYLDALEPDSIVYLSSDDALSTTLYLQRVRNLRRDIHLANLSGGPHWTGGPDRLPGPKGKTYFEAPRRGMDRAIPAGALFLRDLEGEQRIDPGHWREPVAAEELPKLFRRRRGQYLEVQGDELRVRPEEYERRLLRALLLARKNLADMRAREGMLQEAARLYESILKLDPWMAEEASVVFPLAVLDVGLKRYEQAEEMFRRALGLELTPAKRAEACYFLAALCGVRPEAADWKAKALASPDLASELRAKLEGR
jgi:tetratricopeptide (TPR) repeat protein